MRGSERRRESISEGVIGFWRETKAIKRIANGFKVTVRL